MDGSPDSTKRYSSSTSFSGEAGLSASSKKQGNNSHSRAGTMLPVVQDRRVRKILNLIESRPSHRIEDLALECNLSESRLQHLFKERTGLMLGQLLIEQRMQQAAELLVHTDMSIKQIATTIGYEHASSFTRAFERRFRMAPKCFRAGNIGEGSITAS